jgi:hypothetical protein
MLHNWSEEWQMMFNVDKCKVMHWGHKNCENDYEMNDIDLEATDEERDIGVIIQNTLKCNKQCAKAVDSANRVAGMIKRTSIFRGSRI